MSIDFRCEWCGKKYRVEDSHAGKTTDCKKCEQEIRIPTLMELGRDEPAADFGYDLDEPAPAATPAPAPGPSRAPAGWATRPGPGQAASGGTSPGSFRPAPNPGRTSLDDSKGSALLKKAAMGLVVLALIGARVYFRFNRGGNRPARFNVNGPMQQGRQDFPPMPGAAPPMPVDAEGPVQPMSVEQMLMKANLANAANTEYPLPRFDPPGPGREIAPGVIFREVRLGNGPAKDSGPGLTGKLWVYLPAGDHADRSLPCVFIAPAGSNLVTGNDLGDDPGRGHPEHVPYVNAGYAVVAYELDGAATENEGEGNLQFVTNAVVFLRARAGLVNAHVALEYALAQIPQVDPGRLYAAGHSSAGTMALLLAENEPRIRACAAYAPCVDVAGRLGPGIVDTLTRASLGDLFQRYSPAAGESKLTCPLFLFHALDDTNVPAAETEAFAERRKAAGEPVTLVTVPTGDHYTPMIEEGIPKAIEWFKGLP
ncbi:prolyl oligopeptidase family serine peptidase [Isosphaeraceae bacterium EP7]